MEERAPGVGGVAQSRRLCAAVLQRAVVDAKNGNVEAICWLASSKAEMWFDLLDFSQSSLLMKSGWIDWAQVALESKLTDNQYALLVDTLDYLETLN